VSAKTHAMLICT